MSERNLNTGPLDEGTPPIPIPPVEEGWKQMAARLDAVMPTAGTMGAAAKGAAMKSGGIALGKLLAGVAAVTMLTIIGIVYYTQSADHTGNKYKKNTATTESAKNITDNSLAREGNIPQREHHLFNEPHPADGTDSSTDNHPPSTPAVAENQSQDALAGEESAMSSKRGNVAIENKTVAKKPVNAKKIHLPANQNISATYSPQMQASKSKQHTLLSSADKMPASTRNKEEQTIPPTRNEAPLVADSDSQPAAFTSDANAAPGTQAGNTPAATNIGDLLTPIVVNNRYNPKTLQAPPDVINRLFSLRSSRKGYGVSWEIFVQWNVPVAGSNWLKGPEGNTQVYKLLIPGVRLQYNRPNAALSLDLNALATQTYNNTIYKTSKTDSLSSGPPPVKDKYTLLKSYGYSAAIAYQHRIYNKWYGGAGIQAFYAREGAISHIRQSDSINVPAKYNRYGDKTEIWQNLGRLQWSVTAEGFYNHNRWQVGGRVQIPVLLKTDSLTGNIKPQIQAEILLRVKIYKKK